MKVLLVEDEIDVGKVILSMLEQWEMDAVLVQSHREALEFLDESTVDLLITDLVMPEKSGIDLVKAVRREKRHKKIPVLLISGKAEKEHILQASRVGVNGFIAKPFTPDQLKHKIYEACRARRQQLIDRQIKKLVSGREDLHGNPEGPLLVLGEAIKSARDLRDPANRHLVEYLGGALEAIEESNERDPELKLGYILESDTNSIVAHLKKPGTRKWVKLVLLSTRCNGNPILIVRLFSINRSDEIPIGIVYDHPDEIPAQMRKGLKKLGVRLVNRSKFDASRFQALINQFVLGKAPKKKKRADEQALAPKEMHARILDDIEEMTTLPTLPQVYEKVLSLSRDPKSDLKAWIVVIKVDPMTCAAIFRHINSLNYGFDGQISDIDRAIILLGKRTVLGLVACEAVRQTFEGVEEQRSSGCTTWPWALPRRSSHCPSTPNGPAPPSNSSSKPST
jgi:DNA-binding response OmpR family regulator